MIKQREQTHPFDIRDSRAMVSLGPLSPKKYCTFTCPFCYVHADFLSYGSLSIPEIIDWIRNLKDPFDIIYVSGDTDSFAPPRTKQGLELLKNLSEFNVDVLFTTRAVFSSEQMRELEDIYQSIHDRGRYLFGCVSVAQLTFPHLEPRPVPSPIERLNQLKSFDSMGLVAVLAMRPFLPLVPITEYIDIVNYSKDFIDVVLGEVWYADKQGVLEKGVFQGETPKEVVFSDHKMDFDINEATWKIFEAKEIVNSVQAHCDSLEIPFYMRSRPAIEWVRQNGKRLKI